jgi:hypothetical protein
LTRIDLGLAGRAACDLHIQLRAGYHVEVMSSGTTTRADLEQLLAAVPMGALVAARSTLARDDRD